jgi:hypothetical protein
LRLPEAALQGQFTPLLGVARRHHRVVRLQFKGVAVSPWSETMLYREMSLQELLLLATDQADEMVRPDRATHRYSRLGPGFLLSDAKFPG